MNEEYNEKLVEELNELLKGAHMGISIFEDLLEKLKSETLRKEYRDILFALHTHERSIAALVLAERGQPIDSAGLMGSITDVISHIKNLTLDTDKDVLEVSVENMETAKKAFEDFNDRHLIDNENMKKTMLIIKEDYASILHKLERFLIEFQ